MFYVYALRASDTREVFYIGKTAYGRPRLKEHLFEAKKGTNRRATKIKSIINRGSSVEEVVLYQTEDECDAFEAEKRFIAFFGRFDISTGTLTNHTDGGEGVSGVVITESSRKKMSDKKIGNKINVGRSRLDTSARFSKTVSLYGTDGILLATFSSAREASTMTGVSYGQISDCCLGNIQRTRYGSDWAMFRFGDAVAVDPLLWKSLKQIRVQQITKDGDTVKEYQSITHAQNETGIWSSSIRMVLAGKQKTAGGFIWKSVTEK